MPHGRHGFGLTRHVLATRQTLREEHACIDAFKDAHLKPLLEDLTSLAEKLFPDMVKQMRHKLARSGMLNLDYLGDNGSIFTKVSVALNNPTPVHTDRENLLLTVTAVFKVPGQRLRGGSHILFSNACGAQACAVVIAECPSCLVLLGEYAHVLHASMAVLQGERLMVTAYCGAPLVS